jgi:hypothetical protein
MPTYEHWSEAPPITVWDKKQDFRERRESFRKRMQEHRFRCRKVWKMMKHFRFHSWDRARREADFYSYHGVPGPRMRDDRADAMMCALECLPGFWK